MNGLLTAALPDLSPTEATRIGREYREEILRKHKPCTDAELVHRFSRLCHEVIALNGRRSEQYTITLVEDEEINAYSFIGRNIVGTTGFMKFAEADDEMICFVIAHELGHIELGHTDLPFRRAASAESFGPVGAIAGVAAESILRNSPISQAQEREADCFAVKTLKKGGMAPDGGARFFRRIEQDRPPRTNAEKSLGQLFDSHPDSAARIERLRTGCNGE